MENFIQAFLEGGNHIFCLDAVDHILFLLVLTAAFDYSQLKQIFWLVTAFTFGHAITFILAALELTPSVRSWAEIAIPVTIIVSAVINFLRKEKKYGRRPKGMFISYIITVLFGSIHGLAIGSLIQMKLIKGQSFLQQLLGFNIGIEIAQVLVVLILLFIQTFLMRAFRVSLNSWKIAVSGIGIGASLILLKSFL